MRIVGACKSHDHLPLLKLPLGIECRSLAFSQEVYIYRSILPSLVELMFINLETIIKFNNSFKKSFIEEL